MAMVSMYMLYIHMQADWFSSDFCHWLCFLSKKILFGTGYLPGLSWSANTRPFPPWAPEKEESEQDFRMINLICVGNDRADPRIWLLSDIKLLCCCEPRLAVRMKQNKQAGAIWSRLLPKHETPADQSKTTYSVLGVWSHSRRWTPSGRRATRWRCRKTGSYVSLHSSQPRGSDGRISLKDSDQLTF